MSGFGGCRAGTCRGRASPVPAVCAVLATTAGSVHTCRGVARFRTSAVRGCCDDVSMGSTALRFAETARVLSNAARACGAVAPGFRSPPKSLGRDRSIQRSTSGPMVAVRLRGRPFVAVQADLIEGVVVVNDLRGSQAEELRRELWNALEAAKALPQSSSEPSPVRAA